MAASISSVVTWLSVNRVIDVAKRLRAASSIASKLADNVRQGGVPQSAKWLHGLTLGDSFFPRVWPMSLWLGPYMSISSKNVICTKTQKVRKCRQITTNQKPHKPARRPANPPARFAFRQRRTANQTHKRGKSPNKNTHKEDSPRDTAV